MKLYHDDIRYPPSSEWIWARTNQEAIRILETCDIVEASLDHDMGCHNWHPMDIEAAEQSEDWCNGEDGYALALEMIEKNLVPPKVVIHSANPIGVKNMTVALKPHTEMLIVKEQEDA